MDAHCQNAVKVAEYLDKSKYVKVYYPGLAQHLGHDIAKTDDKVRCGNLF